MSTADNKPLSIAVEVALLFLSELESKLETNPDLLVSSEAILSFAAIRYALPKQWEHWKAVLARYQKSDLIEYMLYQPPAADDGDWRSKATRLVALCQNTGLQLFHDPDQRPWAAVRVDQHWENYPLRSRTFHLFLLRRYYQETGENPGGAVLRAVLELFEAQALFDGDQCPVHLRVAQHQGKLYLDLSDPMWRAIEIDAEGWRVVVRAPVRFRRTRGAEPLPEPERNGSLDELRTFLNVDSEGWILIKAFLVAALRPSLPCPILVAKGEQGAGKSTACRVIASLVDPRTSAVRGAPREVRDLIAAARNSWLVCFDNLSHLPQDLADAACRLATGGGFGGRELYSDYEEAVFDAIRPLVFNAIPDLGAARPDFLDRTLIVEFDEIRPELRRDERSFWRDFDAARPRILGALLDAVVCGIRKLPTLALDRLPRMADFATWAIACEEGLKIACGAFQKAYEENIGEAQRIAVEVSPLHEPLGLLAAKGFRGTAAELFAELRDPAEAPFPRLGNWPKSPSALGSALRRMAGSLRASGIEVKFLREPGGRRIISLVRTAAFRKTMSLLSQPSQEP